MVYARYSCSYTITRASSCGNVSRERLQVRSAVCNTAAGSASAPPSAKATSRPSSSQRAVQSASCSDVHCSRPRTARRGAIPRAPPRGFAPRPSLPVPRPAYSGAGARGTRHRPRGAPRPARGPPRRRDSASGIHPTQPMHRRHPIDCDDVRGDAGVHLVLLRGGRDLVERAHHDALEAPVHGVLVPEVTAAVLYPLEVAHGHTAGVRENVGNDENALLLENLVGRRRRWTVRPFADDLRLDLRGVLTGDHVLGGGGHEHVTFHRE